MQSQPISIAARYTYAWPGNIRELEHWVCRECLLGDGPVIQINPVDPPPTERRRGMERRRLELGELDALDYATATAKVLEGFEQRFLASVLARARGNVTAAARLAGTERRYLGKLLKKRGLDKTADHA